jgi:hypothetical protein
MLSNLSKKTLDKKLKYLSTQTRGLNRTGLLMLNKELSKVKAQIEEAKARNVVGETPKGELVYLAPSEFENFEGEILYIEGLPSGWDATAFEMDKGSTHSVVIDGGQNWTTEFTIY